MWNAIVNWLKAQGGVAHVLALGIAGRGHGPCGQTPERPSFAERFGSHPWEAILS